MFIIIIIIIQKHALQKMFTSVSFMWKLQRENWVTFLNIRPSILTNDKRNRANQQPDHLKILSFLGNVDRTLYLLRQTAYKAFRPLLSVEQIDIEPRKKHVQCNHNRVSHESRHFMLNLLRKEFYSPLLNSNDVKRICISVVLLWVPCTLRRCQKSRRA